MWQVIKMWQCEFMLMLSSDTSCLSPWVLYRWFTNGGWEVQDQGDGICGVCLEFSHFLVQRCLPSSHCLLTWWQWGASSLGPLIKGTNSIHECSTLMTLSPLKGPPSDTATLGIGLQHMNFWGVQIFNLQHQSIQILSMSVVFFYLMYK